MASLVLLTARAFHRDFQMNQLHQRFSAVHWTFLKISIIPFNLMKIFPRQSVCLRVRDPLRRFFFFLTSVWGTSKKLGPIERRAFANDIVKLCWLVIVDSESKKFGIRISRASGTNPISWACSINISITCTCDARRWPIFSGIGIRPGVSMIAKFLIDILFVDEYNETKFKNCMK